MVTVPKPPIWNFSVFARDENGSHQAAFILGSQGAKSVPTVRLVLRNAREVIVLVTDKANHPVEQATVSVQSDFITLDRQETDRQGRARLLAAPSLLLQSVYAFKARRKWNRSSAALPLRTRSRGPFSHCVSTRIFVTTCFKISGAVHSIVQYRQTTAVHRVSPYERLATSDEVRL